MENKIIIEELDIPETFVQKELSMNYSFDYRPTTRKLLFQTKKAGYYLISITTFKKSKNRREIIGHMIIEDYNKSKKRKIVFEIFEKGYGKTNDDKIPS